MSTSYHYRDIKKSQITQAGVTSAKIPQFWKEFFFSLLMKFWVACISFPENQINPDIMLLSSLLYFSLSLENWGQSS